MGHDGRLMKGSCGLGFNSVTSEHLSKIPSTRSGLLVDIAIRALSPAINDPTTAVQALDQIEDPLVRLGQRNLEIGAYRDTAGELRLVVPFPAWEDLVRLAFDEICFCGARRTERSMDE
jgi:uncharacterized membrane protein